MPYDIRANDPTSLFNILRASGDKSKAVNAAGAGVQTALSNDMESRKAALLKKVQEAKLMGGKDLNKISSSNMFDPTREYSDDLASTLLSRQTTPFQEASLGLDRDKLAEQERANRAREAMMKAAADKKSKGTQSELRSKATLYAGQAIPADAVLNKMSGQFTGRFDRPDPFGAYPERFKGADRKKYENAALQFAAAVLRPETGAQANADEIQTTIKRFIEQPGDDQDVILQKQAARKTFINLLTSIAQGDAEAGYKLDQMIATPTTLKRADEYKQMKDQGHVALPGNEPAKTGAVDFSTMSDEELMRMANGQ